MPRRKSENPTKTEQLSIRLTLEESAALDAVVFKKTGDNNRVAWARNILMQAVEIVRAEDPEVDRLVQIRLDAIAAQEPQCRPVVPPA